MCLVFKLGNGKVVFMGNEQNTNVCPSVSLSVCPSEQKDIFVFVCNCFSVRPNKGTLVLTTK